MSFIESSAVTFTVYYRCYQHDVHLDSSLTLQNYSVNKHVYSGNDHKDPKISCFVQIFEIPIDKFISAALNNKIHIKFCGVTYVGDSTVLRQIPLRIYDNSNKDFTIAVGKNEIKVSFLQI